MASLTPLVMYDLSPYMNESFITEAFRRMGHTSLGIKIMRNRYTGGPLGHCTIQFMDEKTANHALMTCNGKTIPNSNPPARFKLAPAGGGPGIGFGNSSKMTAGDKEFVLWVGNLSNNVNDHALYKSFATRYNTVKVAKVVKDVPSSTNRGYGFVKFGSEGEHRDALAQMQGFKGLGNFPLLVGLQIPSGSDFKSQARTIGSYAGYIPQAWDFGNYSSYQNYGAYVDAGQPSYSNPNYSTIADAVQSSIDGDTSEEFDDYRLVEYDIPLDIERMNREVMERSLEFWDALDSSRWLPTEGIFTPRPQTVSSNAS